MASSAGGGAANINDYLRVSSGENASAGHYQAPAHLLPPDLSAFLMSANATRSTPGSPATFAGGLGFHSVRTSPALAPSLPQSPGALNGGSFANLAALGGTHPMFGGGFDSAVNSAVQSATASPIVGAFNRRGLLNSMANLNMTQLPPTAMGYMDTSGMFGSPTTPFTANSGPMSAVPSISVSNTSNGTGQLSSDAFRAGADVMSPTVTAEFLQHVEQTKARGLKIELEGIPQENAKSRVETQIKITLRLNTEDTGERATCWSHLALPELLVSREKFRHQLQRRAGGADSGKMPLSPQHVVHLEAGIFCSSDPTRKVETCVGCIRREYKRSLRRKDAGLRSGAPSTCTTPGQSRAGSPAFGESAGARLTGSMEADWDEQRIALEKQRIVIFNCSDILDFSKGEVVLPTRVTCYCRHHNEKEGFCICLTLRDAQGNVLATHISPPIMITDDHKSTKFKVERKSTRARAEYDRQDGSAVYANHALAGLASPLGSHPSHLHLVDGSLAGFKGGRQAMSARCSPTLKPYAHHAILDTYSQFASLAGTPSLGNTPLGSPMLSAAAAAAAAAAAVHMGGFDTPFHLPQAAAYAPTPAQSSASMYGSLSSASQLGAYSVPNSATGAGPALQMAPAYAGLGAASSGSLLFGDGGSAMQVSQLWPVQGPVAGGISVLVCGRGFHGNIAVYFGGVPAGRVQVLSPSNISCVLPPTKTAGPAALRIRDLVTGAVCDGEAVFSYVEDTDHTMLGLALHVTGLRQNPAQEKLGGSPRVSPVLGESPGSPQHQRRSPPSAAGAKMLQDAAVVATLQQLRAASEGRRLVEIEAGLVALFAMLLGKGMLDISRLALRHEATGRTLLHFAALLGMLNLVSFLAAHGVSLDDVDHNGMSPMHFASMYGRADIVELLLSRGAQHGVKSALGTTPGELARILGHTQIQLMLEERDGYMNFIRDEQQQQQQAAATLPFSTPESAVFAPPPGFTSAAAAQPPFQP